MDQLDVTLKVGKPDMPLSFGQDDRARTESRGDFAQLLTQDAVKDKHARQVMERRAASDSATDRAQDRRDDVHKASREILHQTRRHETHGEERTPNARARKSSEEDNTQSAQGVAQKRAEKSQEKTSVEKISEKTPEKTPEEIAEFRAAIDGQPEAAKDPVANDNIAAAGQTQETSLLAPDTNAAAAPAPGETPESTAIDKLIALLELPQPANDNEKAALTEFLKPLFALMQKNADAPLPERLAELSAAIKEQWQLAARDDAQLKGLLKNLPPQKLDHMAQKFAETLLAVEPKFATLAMPAKEEKTPPAPQTKDFSSEMTDKAEVVAAQKSQTLPPHMLRQMLERSAETQTEPRPQLAPQRQAAVPVNPETQTQAAPPQNAPPQTGAQPQTTQTIPQNTASPHFVAHASLMAERDARIFTGASHDFMTTQGLGEGGRTVSSYDAASQLSALRATRGGAAGLPNPVEQVTLHIHRNARQGIDQMSLQLRPAELGRIDIRLHFADGHVRGTVMADNAATLEILLKDIRGLERALQEAGFNADQGCLEFSLRGDGAQRDAEAKEEKSAEEFSLDETEQPAEQAVEDGEIHYITPGRVNIRV